MKKYEALFMISICINICSNILSNDRGQLCSSMARIECTYENNDNNQTTVTFRSADGAGFACVPNKGSKGCKALSNDSPKVKKFCKENMPAGYTKILKIKVTCAGM